MKKITIISMFFVLSISYGQQKECKVEKKHDEFNEITTFQTKSFKISKERYGSGYPGEVQFFKTSFKSGSSFYSMMVYGNEEGCLTKNSVVIFILKTGEKMYFERENDDVDCGRKFIMVSVKEEDISKLLTEVVDKVRIEFHENYSDFTFSEKGQKEFVKNLNCIIETK